MAEIADMNKIAVIPVRTVPGYEVRIGPGLLAQCGEILKNSLSSRSFRRVAVIADSNVAPLYLDKALQALKDAGFDAVSRIFPAGEARKNLETLSSLLEFLAAERFTRADCVIALGGGVTGDMAGFAAAVYLRGVKYIQIPTTLLAAVDSSVGGKTAIDLSAGKNLAGAFHQPAAVLCDTDCLKTLPDAVFADGAAEAIKTGVLSDEKLFALLESGSLRKDPARIIAQCVAYKAGVVERDEREENERRLLNLGHTAGHAIEKRADYTISHGHAVAIGLAMIARASEALGWASEPIAERICQCLQTNHLPVSTEYSPEELADAALSDKKRAGGNITLAIPVSIGHCELKTVPVEDLARIFRAGL